MSIRILIALLALAAVAAASDAEARRPFRIHCKRECLRPTGLYWVCRYIATGRIQGKRLIDINACMH